MLSSSLPQRRIALFVVVVVFIVVALYSASGYTDLSKSLPTLEASFPRLSGALPKIAKPVDTGPISYNLKVAPEPGCEDIVERLQLQLITDYKKLLKGVRYANVWGYLETENKGDAAIWTAQQMLMSQMGIDFGIACRFMKNCNLKAFNESIRAHAPYSAIIMAGGGNFNDFYWEDQPSRISMISNYHDIPIRAFPQSVHMTHKERIKKTKDAFGQHPNLQLAARDRPSYEWFENNLSKEALGEGKQVIKSVLEPDIVFMWGNRPDFRTETKKTHDILILARDDWEISAGNSKSIPFGSGEIDLGGSIGNVTYLKVDWKFTHTPGIDSSIPTHIRGKVQSIEPKKKMNSERSFSTPDIPEFIPESEKGRNQRAWAKAIAGFELLGSARFVITDRLHGHIMSTVIGQPHVLMDSKLKKNLNFHDTWTMDCKCTRITDNIQSALDVARLYFESIEE